MATFVDRVVLHVAGGSGGHGAASIRREKFKPLAGPDGGNGGRGGEVILEVDSSTTTLLSYHHRPHQRATSGGFGQGDMKHGANGGDLVLRVPDGTVVTAQDGTVLADLTGIGNRFVAARGGVGGLGNAALASRQRKAPGFALLGEPGEERSLVLELKSVADVALVGFPSAGKSSLIAAMSAARPKIADYPFTTLVPNLGVVQAGDTRFTVADVPGLIPGASEGKGLGLEFLRHVERCAALVHVIDCATLEPGRDPMSDLDALEAELAHYAQDIEDDDPSSIPLTERPRLVVLNKVDVPEARELADFVRTELEERGYPVFEISTASHEGLRELSFAMARLVSEARAQEEEREERRRTVPVLQPEPARRRRGKDRHEFVITREDRAEEPLYHVRGEKPERWVLQTDFNNDEAVGYLADRFAKLGIEDELFRIGAKPGNAVLIGPEENGVVFDWEPTMVGGAELLGGPRGSDLRLEETSRPTRREKREQFYDRMDAKSEARAELEQERRAGIWTESVDARDRRRTSETKETNEK